MGRWGRGAGALLAAAGGAAAAPAAVALSFQEPTGNKYANHIQSHPEYRSKVWSAFLGERKGPVASGPLATSGSSLVECGELLAAASASGLLLHSTLRRVVQQGNADMLPGCRDGMGRTALLLAAQRGDLDGVDRCLQAAPYREGALRECDKHGISALELAAWKGHVAVVDHLLAAGADPMQRDIFGITALHKAVGHGKEKVVARLLGDGGVNPNVRCGTPSAPPEYEAQTRHQTALHIACSKQSHGYRMYSNPSLVSLLIKYGADPNLPDDDGNTPLHCAARSGDLQAVRMLLRSGADTSARNAGGDVPGDLLPDPAIISESLASILPRSRPWEEGRGRGALKTPSQQQRHLLEGDHRPGTIIASADNWGQAPLGGGKGGEGVGGAVAAEVVEGEPAPPTHN